MLGLEPPARSLSGPIATGWPWSIEALPSALQTRFRLKLLTFEVSALLLRLLNRESLLIYLFLKFFELPSDLGDLLLFALNPHL